MSAENIAKRIAAGFKVAGSAEEYNRLFKRAKNAHEAAKNAVSWLDSVLKEFPDDKAAMRAKSEVEILLRRYEKIQNDTLQALDSLSVKEMPKELLAFGREVAKELQGRLVNPKDVSARSGVYDAYTRKGMVPSYYISFFVHGVQGLSYIDHYEGRIVSNLGNRFLDGKALSPSQFADKFVEVLRSWPGLKSETPAVQNQRADFAARVRAALKAAILKSGGYEKGEVTEERGGMVISAEYRSNNLPKGGASDVGEYEYDEMVEREIARFKKIVEPLLAPLMGGIKNVEYYDGEKSWVTVSVELK